MVSDETEEKIDALYPLVNSLVSGAGGYWLTSEIIPEKPDYALAVGLIFAAIIYMHVDLQNND